MIEETIRQNITKAMKDKNDLAKNVLRVVLGQIQNDSSSKQLSENDKLTIIRKLIKSNNITLSEMEKETNWTDTWKTRAIELKTENSILTDLLPKSMNESELIEFIKKNSIDLSLIKNIGQGIGMIMKELKKADLQVDSEVVRNVANQFIK
jgi:uncharacterized protein YqeY